MRTVEVARRIRATPTEILHHVDPTRLIEYEGTFSVLEMEESEEGTTVTATGGGMRVSFRFEETDDGYRYEQVDEAGPFEEMETTFSVTPKDEGSLVTMRSSVSLSLPIAFISDRIAAWKRRGELKRALRSLEEEVG
ncbi:MAG: SRPBCC family protein [Halodesulfurarchaeum sp.]